MTPHFAFESRYKNFVIRRTRRRYSILVRIRVRVLTPTSRQSEHNFLHEDYYYYVDSIAQAELLAEPKQAQTDPKTTSTTIIRATK